MVSLPLSFSNNVDLKLETEITETVMNFLGARLRE